MAGINENKNYPSDRESFREYFGYDFPYDSDEDPASIDEQYGNAGRKMGGSMTGSFKSSGTGSELLGLTEQPIRMPLSSENLAAATGAATNYSSSRRRISELTSSCVSAVPLDVSVIEDEGSEDIMDAFLKTMDASGRTAGTSSSGQRADKSCAESTFFLGAIDQSKNEGSPRRESLRVKPKFTSDKSVAEKSMAESTFFFGNISTSEEGTARISRERINIPTKFNDLGFLPMQTGEILSIPTKFPMENSDIDLKLMTDDKSVRSALTCDRSYAIEQSLWNSAESAQDEKTDSSGGTPLHVDDSDEMDLLHTRSRGSSPASAKKSTCSSHYGSFMAWPESDDEGETSEEEQETKNGANDENDLSLSARQGTAGGAIVCDFPTDRSAFRLNSSICSERASFKSTSSSKGNSIATTESRKSSDPSVNSKKSSTGRRRSGRRRGSIDKHQVSLRASLETIKSERSFNKSYRDSMRKSLADSIKRQVDRESIRSSLEPRRKSLTEQLHDASLQVPIVGWDDNSLSDSSSLLGSSIRKLRSSALKSFTSLTQRNNAGDNVGDSLLCDEWMTRSSFRKGHDVSGIEAVDVNVPVEEEFDSRKPWMKGPPASIANQLINRRDSTMTLDLDSSVISLKSLDKNISAQLNPPFQITGEEKEDQASSKGGMRPSFTSTTSSLGDDQSISSDITELRQAQEALFSVLEGEAEETGDLLLESDYEYTNNLTEYTSPESSRDGTSPTQYRLEPVKENDTRPFTAAAYLDRLETVEEEPDIRPANSNPSKLSKASFLGPGSQVLDELEVDVSASQRSLRSRNEDDNDTYSDVDVGVEKNSPSLGLYMSVHNHEIETEFNTTEMEEIDFKECRKEQDFNQSDDDLDMFLESQSHRKPSREDHSSHKSGKSSSKRSGLASMKAIHDKWKPIKNRLKKRSGSNHVRRRHKRLYKFCVWNCKKITVLLALVLCVIAGISITSWWGASKAKEDQDGEIPVADQETNDLSMNTQWPPIGDTGRIPLHDTPTVAPSIRLTLDIQNIGGSIPLTNSTSPSFQPSITVGSQNTSLEPSAYNNITLPTQIPSTPLTSLAASSSPVFSNSTSQGPTFINLTIESPVAYQNVSAAPSFYQHFNHSHMPSPSPIFNISLSPSITAYNNSDAPSSNFNSSLFQSFQIISGEAEFQYLGTSVGMTPSAEYIAVGIKEAYGKGMVKVYVRYENVFSPLGVDSMFGDSPGDEFGSAVSISNDGKRVAVGSRSSSSSGKEKNGSVKVYQYSESLNSWLQVGNTIEGAEELERLGFDVDISGDGLRVVCGSPKGSGGLGSATVYDFDRVSWQQVGGVLVGEELEDKAGFSVSLSSDGSAVAVGAISASLNGLEGCGSVTVYNFSNDTWVKSGQVLAGMIDGSQFGYSLALSGDGKRIVVGSNGYSTADQSNIGSCEVFELDSQTSRWAPIGVVMGNENNAEAGYHVSMSDDGTWIACSQTGRSNDAVVIYREEINEWIMFDTILPYFENSTSFGASTFLSRDGKELVVGAPLFNSSTGFVELFSSG